MGRDVRQILEDAIRSIGITPPEIVLEMPREEQFGDISATVAMSLSKTLRKPSIKIAEDIVKAIRKKDIFEKIEVAGPGFINFTFATSYQYGEFRSLLREREVFIW